MLERKQKMPPTSKVTAARRSLLMLLHWSLTYEMNLGRGEKIYMHIRIFQEELSPGSHIASMGPCTDKNLMAAALLSRGDALLENSSTGREVFQLKTISSTGWNTAARPCVSSCAPKRVRDSSNKTQVHQHQPQGWFEKVTRYSPAQLHLSTEGESKKSALPGSVIQTASSSTLESWALLSQVTASVTWRS